MSINRASMINKLGGSSPLTLMKMTHKNNSGTTSTILILTAFCAARLASRMKSGRVIRPCLERDRQIVTLLCGSTWKISMGRSGHASRKKDGWSGSRLPWTPKRPAIRMSRWRWPVSRRSTSIGTSYLSLTGTLCVRRCSSPSPFLASSNSLRI